MNRILVGVVFLVLLVASLGVAWWGYSKLQKRGSQTFEARGELRLLHEIPAGGIEAMLAAENELLDSPELIDPLVEEFELQREWELPSAEAAGERLRKISGLRAGKSADRVVLSLRDPDRELAMRVLNGLGDRYLRLKQAQGRTRPAGE